MEILAPKERVIGSPDSARFRQAIAELVDVDARNVHAYILGNRIPSLVTCECRWLTNLRMGENNPDVDEEAMVNLFFNVRDALTQSSRKRSYFLWNRGCTSAYHSLS